MDNEHDYILPDECMVPISHIDYCSGEDSDDYDDDEDDCDYDKDGQRCWRKKVKNKGDDPSKAINWRTWFPDFDYETFNTEQENLALEEKSDIIREKSDVYSIDDACEYFAEIFDRYPGEHKEWIYVRNYKDCDFYCEKLLQSSILPGIVGVDIEMENDSVSYRDWPARWRTIRVHSRLAKGMFARVLQAANCDGLVVVFDLYALAKPHCWEGSMEMSAKRKDLLTPRKPYPTSVLPDSLAEFILNPGILRFGWALHCDWSSLYNSFGFVVPKKSYLDAQTPWRYVLRDRVDGQGNGLAHAAEALFGIELDKSLRGYGHYWHGRGLYGKIPQNLLMYAVRDAQTSLDVAIQIMAEAHWMTNGSSTPMTGIGKRIQNLFGIPEKRKNRKIIFDTDFEFEQSNSNLDDSCSRQMSSEGSKSIDSGIEQENRESNEQMEDPAESEGQHSENSGSDDQMAENRRIVISQSEEMDQDEKPSSSSKNRCAFRIENVFWKQIGPESRKFILSAKGKALKVFNQLSRKSEWTWCPAFIKFCEAERNKLKRLIREQNLKKSRALYRKARTLLDNNLEWAWKQVSREGDNPWEECKKFQEQIFDESEKSGENVSSSFSRKKRDVRTVVGGHFSSVVFQKSSIKKLRRK